MNNRKVFNDSVTALPDQPGLTQHGLMVQAAAPLHRNETMTLLFSLAIPQDLQRELEERVAKGEVIPPEELNRKYSIKNGLPWLRSATIRLTGASSTASPSSAPSIVSALSPASGSSRSWV